MSRLAGNTGPGAPVTRWVTTMKSRFSAYFLVPGAVLLSLTSASASDLNHQTGKSETDGAAVFLKYCAGCHGFDGFAAYSAAPSFSMGDRLQKSDSDLLQSVMRGKGAMPSWEDKLPVPMLASAIQYLRLMNKRIKSGQNPPGQTSGILFPVPASRRDRPVLVVIAGRLGCELFDSGRNLRRLHEQFTHTVQQQQRFMPGSPRSVHQVPAHLRVRYTFLTASQSLFSRNP